MRVERIDLGARSYDVIIEPGIASTAGNHYASILGGKKVAVVTDTNVGSFHGSTILNALRKSGIDPVYMNIEPGESSKSMEVITRLCKQFVHTGLERNSVVIAFGGGVVGDVAGFASAIYLRGIDFIQIPTTLLADCDSAVGGKVGVNFERVKNLLGSFYQPKLVLIDPDLLKTLPQRELKAGLVEVIKTGLIGDVELYRIIFSRFDDIIELKSMELLSDIIQRSVVVKADIVSRDEKESGLRRILNFGHTIGHAIEGVFGEEAILHGEAILYGMRAAIRISYSKGALSKQDYSELIENLAKLHVPVDISNISFEQLLEFIQKDKKIVNNRLRFILLECAGKPFETQDIGESELADAFASIQKFQN